MGSYNIIWTDELVDLCRLGIGWDTSLYELMQIGERRINMMRFFNAREGFTKKDDMLPERIFKPLNGGETDGVVLDREAHENAKGLYYELLGWNKETGNPTEANLRKLSLQWLLEK